MKKKLIHKALFGSILRMGARALYDYYNNQLVNKTPELKGSKEAYLNRLQKLGFTARPTPPTKPLIKKNNNSNSYYINGFQNSMNSNLKSKNDVKTFLLSLIDLGYNLGKFGADGTWGKDTLAAYDKYLADLLAKLTEKLKKNLPPILSVPISTTTVSAPTVETNNIPNVRPTRTGNYDRSEIRQLMREKGINPYEYSGALRKALRLWLNGLSDDTSLFENTNLYNDFILPYKKKGGRLISKNPIKRFKMKFAWGGN